MGRPRLLVRRGIPSSQRPRVALWEAGVCKVWALSPPHLPGLRLQVCSKYKEDFWAKVADGAQVQFYFLGHSTDTTGRADCFCFLRHKLMKTGKMGEKIMWAFEQLEASDNRWEKGWPQSVVGRAASQPGFHLQNLQMAQGLAALGTCGEGSR